MKKLLLFLLLIPLFGNSLTPVFTCGAECGINNATIHISFSGTGSFSTSTVRSGERSLRFNPTGGTSQNAFILSSSNIFVGRCYIRFATLPNANCFLFGAQSGQNAGAIFNSSDNKIYPGRTTGPTFGSTGFSVTTDVWYRLDVKVNISANPWLIDVSVDGTALTQLSTAVASGTYTSVIIGATTTTNTSDIFYDDILLSQTSGDFPIGGGYVNHFIPTADGTHNIAGANDFERSATGTDITNATTTAFQLIDDFTAETGTTFTDYINLIAPPNATDYVECIYGPATGISTPTAGPRIVCVIVAVAASASGTNNIRIALNDNGTTDDVVNASLFVGSANVVWRIKNYTDPPSAASSWTVSGNGNFNNIRVRCYTNDAAPDPYFGSTIIEAEFEEIAARPRRVTIVTK